MNVSLTLFNSLQVLLKDINTVRERERGRERDTMECLQFLHMNKGEAETSYAKNSTLQVTKKFEFAIFFLFYTLENSNTFFLVNLSGLSLSY